MARPAEERPLVVTIVEHNAPDFDARWLAAMNLLLEAGRQPEEASA
jgi:hypothetical protein